MKNVLKVTLALLILVIFLVSCSSGGMYAKGDAGVKVDEGTVITGTVLTKENAPLKGAYVYLYSTKARGQMGPSDFISKASNEKGEFSISAAAGEYFIIARKRKGESNVGVLDTGDYSSKTGEKITVEKGETHSINLTMNKIVEPMFFKKTGVEITDTGIKGVILDHDGNAIAGAFAIAYTDKGMKKLPNFASVPTQADGSYVLFLPEAAGTYYIGARVNTKKPPLHDELYGTYKKTEDHSVTVEKGKFLEDVNVTLEPFKGTVQTEFKGFE